MVNKTQWIYTSTIEGAFEEMLRDALLQVDAAGVIKLAIFNLPTSNCEYKQNLETIDRVTKEVFGELPPLTSYISQKTSHGGLPLRQHTLPTAMPQLSITVTTGSSRATVAPRL